MTDMNEMMLEMLELLQEVEAKMQRIHEIKAKFEASKPTKEVICSDERQRKQENAGASPDAFVKKSNTITCSCGCTVVFSSLKRHQKTKKHTDMLAKKPKFIDAQVADIFEDAKKQPKVLYDKYSDEEAYDIATEVINLVKPLFHKGLYVKNYNGQKNLESCLRTTVDEILAKQPDIRPKQIVKDHMKEICETLNEHIETYQIQDIAPEKKTFIDGICTKLKACDTPFIYSLNNITTFKQALSKKMYNDFADMKNRGENHVLLKDFVDETLRQLLAEHVNKYGYNTEGIKEYLSLKQEV